MGNQVRNRLSAGDRVKTLWGKTAFVVEETKDGIWVRYQGEHKPKLLNRFSCFYNPTHKTIWDTARKLRDRAERREDHTEPWVVPETKPIME